MSVEQATAFIEKMKFDGALRGRVMAAKGIEERIVISQSEGFDCTIEDIETMHAANKVSRAEDAILPHSWQAGGPCHRKCAP